MKTTSFFRVVLGAALLCGATLSHAALITIDSTDSGWYTSVGYHQAGNTNHLSGFYPSQHYRNFFVFDLSSITDTIVSATLRLNARMVTASATYTLYDVTTDITSLRAGGTGLTGIYSDLGSGDIYGSRFISSGLGYNSIINIPLNALAKSSMNDAPTVWAIGGDFLSTSGYAFGASDTRDVGRLRLTTRGTMGTVPAPGALALLGLGLLSLVCSRRMVRIRTRTQLGQSQKT